MESIKEIFRIGRSLYSNHTIGPVRAAQLYRKKLPQAKAFRITLYGSLALGRLAVFSDSDSVNN